MNYYLMFKTYSKEKHQALGNVNHDRPVVQNTFKSPRQMCLIWRDGSVSRNRAPLPPFRNPAHAIRHRKRSSNLHPKNWGSYNFIMPLRFIFGPKIRILGLESLFVRREWICGHIFGSGIWVWGLENLFGLCLRINFWPPGISLRQWADDFVSLRVDFRPM